MQFEKDFEIMQLSSQQVFLLCTIREMKTEETLLHHLPVELLYQILFFSELPPHSFTFETNERVSANRWTAYDRAKAKMRFVDDEFSSEFALISFRPVPHRILASPSLYHPFFVDNAIHDESRFSVLLQHSIHKTLPTGQEVLLTGTAGDGKHYPKIAIYLCTSSSAHLSPYHVVKDITHTFDDPYTTYWCLDTYRDAIQSYKKNKVLMSLGMRRALDFYAFFETDL